MNALSLSAFADRAQPAPHDFGSTFLRIGRLACEEHYKVSRSAIDCWLDECGKRRLIAARAAVVRQRRREGLQLSEMRIVLEAAFGVPNEIPAEVARQAAHYLRVSRNGGWRVSQAGDGLWWVGLCKRTAAELVEMAKRAGFEATLSDDGGPAVE